MISGGGLELERSSTGFSSGLLSKGSKSTTGRSTINPYATLAAASPTLRPREGAEGDDGGTVLSKALSLATGSSLLPPAGEGAGFFPSLFNSINMLLGIGVLAYPKALLKVGWFGLAILLFLTFSTRYTAGLLKKSIEVHTDCHSFSDLGRRSYGKAGTVFITVVFFLELLLGSCTAYLIVLADNLNSLYPSVSTTYWALVGTAAILPTTFLKDLSKIAYLSYVGVLSAVVLTGVIMYVGFDDNGTTANFDHVYIGDVIDPKYIFWSTGIFAVGFSGHPVFTSVYTSMKEKKRFPEMLNYTYLVTFLFYGGIAVMGYLLYGQNTSEEITLNLPENAFSTKLCKWTIIINSYCTFTLVLEPISEVVEDVLDFGTPYGLPREDVEEEVGNIQDEEKVPRSATDINTNGVADEGGGIEVSPFIKRTPSEALEEEEESQEFYFCGMLVETARYVRKVAIRATLTLLVTVITVSVPNFDQIMAFAGAFLSITVSVFFPSFAYVKLMKVAGRKLSWFELIINRILAVLGVILAIGGTVSSFIQR